MTPRQALYLIGVPGVGKTTLLRMALVDVPVFHSSRTFTVLAGHGDRTAWELGCRRPGLFSGTDALALNAQPQVLQNIATAKPELLVGEGDRLANGKFFQALVDLGYDLHVVQLTATAGCIAERRAARGTEQDASWIRGRETKVRRLAEEWQARLIDATSTVYGLMELAQEPVIETLRAGLGQVAIT